MPASMIDWGRAEQTAVRIAERSPAPSAELDGWNPPIEQIEQQIEDVTGLRSVEGTATAELIDRPAWIRANLTSFQALLTPVLTKLEEQRPKSGLGAGTLSSLSRQMAGAQLGALLGWMGTRVLGQYDLLVRRTDATSDGAVYLVGPNLASLEQRFGFEPHEFRTWVLVHELTHRAQFTGVPWMKGYYLSLVESALSSIDPDPRRLVQALARAADEFRNGRNPLDDGGLVALLASDEQRGALAQVQALMSLLEGHGNAVMNQLGREHVAGQARMARVLQARRQSTGMAAFLQKLVGLESKMRQYEVGETFIAAVEREAGPRAIDAAWRGPEFLPTIDELSRPNEWLARVDGAT